MTRGCTGQGIDRLFEDEHPNKGKRYAAQHSDDLLSERTLCCKAHITDLDESARQNAKKGAGSGIAVIFHRGGIYYKITRLPSI